MLSRYVITTFHGEAATVFCVWDTEAGESRGFNSMECVKSFNTARGETFGQAYQYATMMNESVCN
jgi:hypothetical protein